MTHEDNQKIAANFMGAIAHLLSGRPGRLDDFIGKVEPILSGDEPDASRLMGQGDEVRRTGRPVLWFHVARDFPEVPMIGLAASVRDRMYIVENCLLWSPAPGARAYLVPDSFEHGSFQFDADLRLRHFPKSPVADLAYAKPGIVFAWRRLRTLEADQRERGEEFALPQLFRIAA